MHLSRPRLPGVVNDFTRGMAMMQKHDPLVQEYGFGLVKGVAAEHVYELIAAYSKETHRGLRCWLLELLGESRSPEALPVFVDALASPDDSIRDWGRAGLEKLDTKDARTLWRESTASRPRSDRSCRLSPHR